MRKPILTDALTRKATPVETAPVPQEAKRERLTDQRINTTLRLEPDLLEALKIVAAKERVRVNDLLLESVRHVLALRRQKSAA